MRPAAVEWERAAEVGRAARGWRGAGAIDEPTERAILAAFPDPCLTPGPVWRVLTAAAVVAIVLCAFGAFAVALGRDLVEVLLFLFAAANAVAADRLGASPPWARRGVAGATALLAVGFLLVGVAAVGDASRMSLEDTLDALLVFGLLAGGAAAWRWGSPAFAGLAAVSLFLGLGRLPLGRLWWLAVGATLALAVARGLDEPRWAPSHRRSAAVVVVVGLAAAYAAVNLYSLDEVGVESFARWGARHWAWPPAVRALSAVATAAFPLAVLAWGLRARRPLLLDVGLVLLALSLATVRQYVHVAPLWGVLTVGGALLIGLALAVERALRRAAGAEIAGFTAAPLFSDERRQRALQALPVVAAFTPAPPAPESPGFTGEGGRFGGGGASDRY